MDVSRGFAAANRRFALIWWEISLLRKNEKKLRGF
jgi:hypothetical protein